MNSTVNGLAGSALHDDDVLDRRRVLQGLVGDSLELHDVAAAIAAVGRDEQARLLIVDAIAQRFGAEAAEDDAVHGADARAGEHRDGQLRDERQVDRDAIALADPQRLEHVGELADLAVQLPVRDGAPVAGLALPDDRGLVATPAADVPVQAVHARVERAADEPLRVRRLPVEHLGPRRAPLELGGKPRPECLGVACGLVVDFRVADMSGCDKRRRRVEVAVLLQERVNLGELVVGHGLTTLSVRLRAGGWARASADEGARLRLSADEARRLAKAEGEVRLRSRGESRVT